MKHFISLKDLREEEIYKIFELARDIKKSPAKFSKSLKGKTLGLLFEKPSLRTRVSFEVGIKQLGGTSLYLSAGEVQLGKREAVSDIARTLSKYLGGVILRTFSHNTLLEFLRNSWIPVINGLTDLLHPAQALSDLYTIYEKKNNFRNIKISFIGDGNNVCHSLMLGAARLGITLFVANPKGYEPDKKITRQALRTAKESKATIEFSDNPKVVAKNSDILYTDVWVSMGKEKERLKRLKAFRKFQVNSQLLKLAKKDCLVMHCLPAHRGQEITNKIIDSKHSIVFKQAENRLYVQKAIIVWLCKKGKK